MLERFLELYTDMLYFSPFKETIWHRQASELNENTHGNSAEVLLVSSINIKMVSLESILPLIIIALDLRIVSKEGLLQKEDKKQN